MDVVLIEIERRPEVDKRKEFFAPTLRLRQLVGAELVRLGINLAHYNDELQFLDIVAGIDPKTG